MHFKEKSTHQLVFQKKVIGKNVFFEIHDIDDENFFELDIFSYKFNIPYWFNRTFLGLKLIVWLILLTSAILLIPLIIFVAYRDNLSEGWQNALLISGIILMSSGALFFIVFLLLNKIEKTRIGRLKNEINKISTEILRLAMEYSERKSDKIICWKCFEEIKEGMNTCPKCGIKL